MSGVLSGPDPAPDAALDPPAEQPCSPHAERRCRKCGKKLRSSNPKDLCSNCNIEELCEDVPATTGPQLAGEAAPGEVVAGSSAKVDAVLDTARTMLAALEDPRTQARAREHGTIAAAFVMRFMLDSGDQEFGRAVLEILQEILRIRLAGPRVLRDERVRVKWDRFSERLARMGIHVRPSVEQLLDPSQGPDVVLATALSFPYARVSFMNFRLKIRIWSALMPADLLKDNLAELFQRWSVWGSDEALFRQAVEIVKPPQWVIGSDDRMETRFEAKFCDRADRIRFPYIKLTLFAHPPLSPDLVIQWYQRGPWRRWQHRLWDGEAERERGRAPSPETLVRGWTLLTLYRHAGLSLRDAVRVWNECAPVRLVLPIGGPAISRESVASRERNRAQRAAEALGFAPPHHFDR